MRAKRRTLTTYFVEPFKQIRFGLHVVAVCLAYVALLGWLYTNAFTEQYQQVIEIFSVVDTAALVENDVFVKHAFIIGSALAALVGTMLFVVVRRTHKMYGPMVSIHRFVGDLNEGNYKARIAVRENDDFQPLVQELNDLAEKLLERHPETAEQFKGKSFEEQMEDLEAGVVTISEKRRASNKEDSGNQAS